MAYGYRAGEFPTALIKDMDPDVKIKLKPSRPRQRMITQASLGVQDKYACMPAVDRNHAPTLLAGLIVRLAAKRPERPTEFRSFFEEHFLPWVQYWFDPVPADTDVSLEHWLEDRPYPQSRKDELRRAWVNYVPGRARRLATADAFIKAENYKEPKHARFICPLPDYVKAVMGGVAHAIEQQIISGNRFIKKIPANLRVQFMRDKLLSAVMVLISEGDFSKMEGQHCKFINTMMCKAFAYFTAELPDGPEYMRFFRGLALHEDCTGEFDWHNDPVLQSQTLELYNAYILQSGKMETSIQNALLNMALYDLGNLFFFGIDYKRDTNDVFEGDDGWTTSGVEYLTTEHYFRMGHVRTTRTSPAYDTEDHNASGDFCSMVFEIDEQIMVTNVVEAYVGFGWATDAYTSVRDGRLAELLRARAYSMLYQYDSCPILHEMASWVLRKTTHVRLDAFFARRSKICHYEMDQYRIAYEALRKRTTFPNRCGMKTRLLVEKMYGPTVDEQLRAEAWLLDDPPLQPLSLIDTRHFHPSWIEYHQKYVVTADRSDIIKGSVCEPQVAAMFDVYSKEFFGLHGEQISGFGKKGAEAVAAIM